MVRDTQQMSIEYSPPARPVGAKRPLAVGIAAALLGFALGAAIGAVALATINPCKFSSAPSLQPVTELPPPGVSHPGRANSSEGGTLQTLLDLHQQQLENAKLAAQIYLLRSQQKEESIMALPYLQHFENGLNYGMVITIRGFVQPKAFRLPVILKYGPGQSDVALLFSPRFETNQMVRNHLKGDQWGNEETAGPVPVKPSHHFLYEIRVLQHMYEIHVDGVHYCDFVHRLPYNKVKYLDIHGDLVLTMVSTQQMLL